MTTAGTGAEGLQVAARQPPDLVILALDVLHTTCLEAIHSLRVWSTVPILVVSEGHDARDKVIALDAGADDYVIKPFAVHALSARVRALTRRSFDRGHDPIVAYGNVTIDFATRRITRRVGPDKQSIRLTPTEWRILDVLARSANRLVTREDLLLKVWGPAHTTHMGYLRLYVAQLRKKLETNSAEPRFIVTVHGVGYRFVSSDVGSGSRSADRRA